jgi:hypothetical protein
MLGCCTSTVYLVIAHRVEQLVQLQRVVRDEFDKNASILV